MCVILPPHHVLVHNLLSQRGLVRARLFDYDILICNALELELLHGMVFPGAPSITRPSHRWPRVVDWCICACIVFQCCFSFDVAQIMNAPELSFILRMSPCIIVFVRCWFQYIWTNLAYTPAPVSSFVHASINAMFYTEFCYRLDPFYHILVLADWNQKACSLGPHEHCIEHVSE
jgi:hypothetical protein